MEDLKSRFQFSGFEKELPPPLWVPWRILPFAYFTRYKLLSVPAFVALFILP
jgi:hypothetical protein